MINIVVNNVSMLCRIVDTGGWEMKEVNLYRSETGHVLKLYMNRER